MCEMEKIDEGKSHSPEHLLAELVHGPFAVPEPFPALNCHEPLGEEEAGGDEADDEGGREPQRDAVLVVEHWLRVGGRLLGVILRACVGGGAQERRCFARLGLG